jgi:hypothetical protein
MVVRTCQLIGPGEAGRILNVTPERVRQLARARVLASVPLGNGRTVYTIEDVHNLAKQRTRQARIEVAL